ncbi:NYN domain-containing protein [Thermogymnomonas acidicola]|uniref:NYN domain-containing protein n=1 Tax=Thermogymnomonas acidicola TaxID=399579 RepID=UPI0009464E47|nr:NYN domain-containing protein [Thermogymnomonas acidicola]
MYKRGNVAVFIDFENFYYSLKNLYSLSFDQANDRSVSIISEVTEMIEREFGPVVIRRAYADWSNLSDVKRELERMGVRIIDVLSTEHKNSADIELSLSVFEILLTRPDVETMVIFAGDRDYMPIAMRVKESGKKLMFIGFQHSLSGDLKKLVGEGNYMYVDREIQGIGIPAGENQVTSLDDLSPDEQLALQACLEAYDQYRDRYGSVKLGGLPGGQAPEGAPGARPHGQEGHIPAPGQVRCCQGAAVLLQGRHRDFYGLRC